MSDGALPSSSPMAGARDRGRSYLFVPGSRPDRFNKAVASGTDRVILDLEDALTVEQRPAARVAVGEWLSAGNSAIVRVNAVGTDDFDADCEALVGLEGLQAVMVPKAERPAALRLAAEVFGVHVGLIALIETALGVHLAVDIASTTGVSRLAFGSIDFCLSVDCLPTHDALLAPRSALVMASVLGGLPAPIDGVTAKFDDVNSVFDDATVARSLGFGAKLCVHPSQVDAVHRGFAPSEGEVNWARAVLGTKAQGEVSSFKGEMLDRPMYERAMRILAHE